MFLIYLERETGGAEEMTQWLRELAALSETWVHFPRPRGSSQAPVIPTQRHHFLLASSDTRRAHDLQTYMQAFPHTHKK